MSDSGTGRKARELIDRIRPILAGNPPAVISAVLCDLLALLLAGHAVDGDAAETHRLREKILQHHVEYLWKLVNVNAKLLDTPCDDNLVTGPHPGQYH